MSIRIVLDVALVIASACWILNVTMWYMNKRRTRGCGNCVYFSRRQVCHKRNINVSADFNHPCNYFINKHKKH